MIFFGLYLTSAALWTVVNLEDKLFKSTLRMTYFAARDQAGISIFLIFTQFPPGFNKHPANICLFSINCYQWYDHSRCGTDFIIFFRHNNHIGKLCAPLKFVKNELIQSTTFNLTKSIVSVTVSFGYFLFTISKDYCGEFDFQAQSNYHYQYYSTKLE